MLIRMFFMISTVFCFMNTFCMDRADKLGKNKALKGKIRSSQSYGSNPCLISSSSANIGSSPSVAKNSLAPHVPWIGVSESVERFTALHNQGTDLYMQAFEGYLELLSEENITPLRKLLPKFYEACACYLDAWELGDPTAEGGCERSYKQANIILRLLHSQNHMTSSGSFDMPAENFQILERMRNLQSRDEKLYENDFAKVMQEMLNTNDTSTTKERKNLHAQGHNWYASALTTHSDFADKREKSWLEFLRFAGWASDFLVKSFKQSSNLKILERLIDLFDRSQPQKWGMDSFPDTEDAKRLQDNVQTLNTLLAIEGEKILIDEYRHKLSLLNQGSLYPRADSRDKLSIIALAESHGALTESSSFSDDQSIKEKVQTVACDTGDHEKTDANKKERSGTPRNLVSRILHRRSHSKAQIPYEKM